MVYTKNTLKNLRDKIPIKKSKKNLTELDLSKIKFFKRDILGEGAYAKVYKLRIDLGNNQSKIIDKYVVKKMKILFLKRFYGDYADQEILSFFNKGVIAIIHLSKLGIAPKVFGIHSNIKKNSLYFIIQKLDITLGDMLRNKKFKIEYTDSFINIMKKLLRTRYRHTDLHVENIMFNNDEKRFYLIDFGHHKELTKENDEGFFYTENSESEDIMLFDKTRGFENSILGTSGASALSQIYKFIVIECLRENIKALKYLNKLKLFIKTYTSDKNYKNIINLLNKNVGVSDDTYKKLTLMKIL